MTRNGFRNIRAAIKSERAYHKRWDDLQRRKLEQQFTCG
jgi:hypothetical protein